MGCCSSKLPIFPASSAADGIAPISPPDEFDSQLIKFIPQTGMFGNSIGVYLPNDIDAPTYFFQPTGGSYKMFKAVMGGKEEMTVIKSGWQSSQGYDQLDTMGNQYGNVTTKAKKTLTVVTKQNGMEHKVKIVKTFDRGSGSKVELDEGYSIQENFNTNGVQPRLELTLDGNIIAHVYEGAASMGPTMVGAGGGVSGAIKNAMAIMKAPMALYIKRSLSETEMVRALTIIATANDRLIRIACLDINGGGVNHNNFGHDLNQHYNNGGGGYSGDDGGDYGGDDGGGDYGGGDDTGGGGE